MIEEGLIVKFKGDEGSLTKSSNAAAASLKKVDVEGKKLTSTIETLRGKMEAKKQFLLTETDISRIKSYNQDISRLKTEIAGINKIGINADGANKLSEGFNNAFSSVRKLAFILPGIGIAGIFGFAADEISRVVSALVTANTSLSDFKLRTDSVNEAMRSTEYAKASESLSELTINVGLAKQGLLDKNAVLKQYNESIGKTTGQVSSLDEAENSLVKNGPAYLRMILLQSAAHLTLEKAAKKTVDAEIDFQETLAKAKNVNTPGQAAIDKQTGAGGLSEFLSRGLTNEANAAKTAADKRVHTLNDIAAGFQKEAAEIAKKFKFNFFPEKPEPIKTTKPVKVEAPVLLKPAGKIELEVRPGSEASFKDLNDSVFKGSKEFEEFAKRNLAAITIAPRINIVGDNVQFDPEEMLKKLKLAEATAALSSSASQALQSIATTAFTGIGDAIGAALTGGNLKDVFASLFQSIGNVIQDLGKQMIALSPLVQSIKLAIQSFNPALMLAAGVGLVALGGVVKGAFAHTKFAEGGLVFGPTMGLIGEGRGTSRSNPEVVAPLDKLKDFVGSNQGGFPQYLPSFELSGDTLRLWYQRANASGRMFK